MKKTLAITAIPSMLIAYGWARYQKAVDELDRYQPASPILPGSLHAIPTTFGTVSYRMITGDPHQPPLVLIHGWGRTGDSAWWTIVWKTDRTMVLVDLPGHGRSRLRGPFTLDLATEAIIRVVKHAELADPVLVGHSMGGAIALLVGRKLGGQVSHIGILASSAFWVKPKLAVTLAAAPYVMAPNSPIIIRRQHRQAIQVPHEAGRVIWEYAARPTRSTLWPRSRGWSRWPTASSTLTNNSRQHGYSRTSSLRWTPSTRWSWTIPKSSHLSLKSLVCRWVVDALIKPWTCNRAPDVPQRSLGSLFRRIPGDDGPCALPSRESHRLSPPSSSWE